MKKKKLALSKKMPKNLPKIILIILTIISLLLLIIFYFPFEKHTSGNKFTITKNKAIYLKDYNMKIKIISISDSRCPKNVQCIRAGEITYKLQVKEKNKTYYLIIDTVNHKKVILNEKYYLQLVSYKDTKSVTFKILKK